jgi:HEAT repeat protein
MRSVSQLISSHGRRVALICLLACAGCTKEKSTSDLVKDVKGKNALDKISAVRLLAERDKDAAQAIPALIEALEDKDALVRKDAAIGLGTFGEQAKDAVPSLQALQRDGDARVREAAGVALSRIDPARFSSPSKAHPGKIK